jgi:signal transduction histidine kinase
VASLGLLSLQGILDPRYDAPGAAVANVIYVAMTWAVAAAVRIQVERSQQSVAWAQTAVRTSEENARQAVLDERARLARELHDVLGHSISVMVLRARGGVHEHEVDTSKGAEALRDIEAVGCRALADVRILLELDNEAGPGDEQAASGSGPPQHHPLPGLDDITTLVAGARSAGLEVELQVRGEPRSLGDSLGLTAYRVTQESLTNVMRHSLSRVASVILTWTDSDLLVEVNDDGPADPAADSSRRGLIGMNDRVTLVGGSLVSGNRPDGGFTVSARIPLSTRA